MGATNWSSPPASCRLSIQKAAAEQCRKRGMPITVHLLNIRHAFLCMRADVCLENMAERQVHLLKQGMLN